MKTHHLIRRVVCAVLLALAFVRPAHGQWQTQSMTLKPGWNAVYLHVDASHIMLDSLIAGAGNPIAEIWMWQPPISTVQFVTSPSAPTVENSQWAVWDRNPAVADSFTRLLGNAAYLVRNTNNVDFVWNVTGKPVPPNYQWAVSGLNFIGFPTPTNSPPNFDNFLALVPTFKAQFLPNSIDAGIYRYQGGELGATNPVRVLSQLLRNVNVKRGEAYWINAGQGTYNHYFGPFEVSLQNSGGVAFGTNLGTYLIRVKNTTESNRTVSLNLNLRSSEIVPAGLGQTAIFGAPPLLVRGALNPTTLTYGSTTLTTNSAAIAYTLTSQGTDGSEIEIILGLNRSQMTGPVGSFYAGILRFTDSAGYEQVDIPVSASVGDNSGLWVGQAAVSSVNHYLKTYANTNNPASIPKTNSSGYVLTSLPATNWTVTAAPAARWRPIASSADGTRLLAAAISGSPYLSTNGGLTWAVATNSIQAWTGAASSADGSKLLLACFATNSGVPNLFTSSDFGATWTSRDIARNWNTAACSADGTRMLAGVNVGYVYVSTDSGATWIPRITDVTRVWTALASSADGLSLAATAGTNLFISVNGGTNWSTPVTSPTNAFTALASSADGLKLVAASTGTNIFTSIDGGTNWIRQTNSPATNWISVASSADGLKLVAVVNNGQVYASTDAGGRWTTNESARGWADVVSSADGTKLFATVNNATTGQIYASAGSFTTLEVDPASGRIAALGPSGAPYVTTATNTSAGAVAQSFPLRLILHNNSGSGVATLLQRVYHGTRLATNIVVATQEAFLDATNLASAHRISAAHLPFSHTNRFWSKTSGTLGLGGTLVFNINLDYADQVTNPFLHTYHPDHDNLKSDFKTVEVQGAESYTVSRQITLSVTSPASDFSSLTAAGGSLTGNYTEVITFAGRAGNTRQFTVGGAFVLNRISPIATLTTQ